MTTPPKPWEQLENETPEAYTRFLVYRNLGPGRSIAAAYKAVKGGKKREPSGQWERDSVAYNWPDRAARWDVAQLSELVPEATANIFKAISETARIALRELESGRLKPANWAELKETVTLLASFISPEVITSAIDNAGNTGSESPGDDAGAQ